MKPVNLKSLSKDPAQEAGRESNRQKNTPLEATYDPIVEATKRHSSLTKEKALEMAEAFGF